MVKTRDGQVWDGPATDAASVTPNDSADLSTHARGLWVGGAGNVKIDTLDGTTVTVVGAAAGSVVPIGAKRVYSTDTTATSILALF